MTPPAASALCLCVMSLLLAAWILGLTQSPGWRNLRSFVGIAASAAGFGFGTLILLFAVSDVIIVWGTRIALMSGLLSACSWIVFSARLDARPFDPLDRVALGAALTACVLALVPGVLISDHVVNAPPGGQNGLVRFADTTLMGDLAMAIPAVSNVWVGVQLLRRARRRRGHAIHALSVLLLVPLATVDTFAAHGHLEAPSMLSLGMLLSVATVGVQISRRVADDTQALATVSERLALAQERLLEKERLAAVGEAAAIVSHEVRNPLGVLFNVFNQLRRTLPIDAKPRPDLERALEAAGHIDAVVSTLIASSGPSAPAYAGDARGPRTLQGLAAPAAQLPAAESGDVAPSRCATSPPQTIAGTTR